MAIIVRSDESLSGTLKPSPTILQLDNATKQGAGSHSTARPPSVIHSPRQSTYYEKNLATSIYATLSLNCSWNRECHRWRSSKNAAILARDKS
jgi:hypothetical protein